jgi:hypothetical protein
MLPLQLAQQVQSIVLTYWLRWGLTNFLPRLALNHNLPHLCLSSSWDYRHDQHRQYYYLHFTDGETEVI